MPGERPHCQVRRVEKVGVSTPLIVPSFSSCGFPQVAEIYDEMKGRLYGVCLVSALDMAAGCIPANVTDEANLVLVDSGMFEARSKVRGRGGSCPSTTHAGWSRQQYCRIAAGLDASANVILVNYDGTGPVEQQIRQALEDFSYASHAASDFLVKPECPSYLVNVPRLATHIGELGQFDIVGITAREAGDSLARRCSTVVMLRDALDDAGLDAPIHVFGAISPLEVLTYCFCGADVFDGLNWLRLSFREHGSIPIEEAAFEDRKATLADFNLRSGEWLANLRCLYRLQESLRRYGLTRDLEALARDFPPARKAARIAELAGAVMTPE